MIQKHEDPAAVIQEFERIIRSKKKSIVSMLYQQGKYFILLKRRKHLLR